MLTYLARQGQGAGRALCSLLTDFATSTHPVVHVPQWEGGIGRYGVGGVGLVLGGVGGSGVVFVVLGEGGRKREREEFLQVSQPVESYTECI